jgi:hypothetical protein
MFSVRLGEAFGNFRNRVKLGEHSGLWEKEKDNGFLRCDGRRGRDSEDALEGFTH